MTRIPANLFKALAVTAWLTAGGLLVSFALPQTSYAQRPPGDSTGVNACSKPTFLGLVPWYQYLTLQPYTPNGSSASNSVCKIQNFESATTGQTGADDTLGGHSPFLLIALAIVDDMLRVATLVAVGYVIYGGFKYMTSNGSPDGTKSAQNTVINALAGLVIAILAAAIVDFIGKRLGGT